jgi:hypothetical protein
MFHVVTTGGQPQPVVAPPPLAPAVQAINLWLLLKVFASGCTAMTGVEAVSNGVLAFRKPTAKMAQITLTIIIALLILLLAGIALLCRAYGVGATDPDSAGYQSVLSMLTAAVMGRGYFYYLTIASILLVLSLSANTAFADFPRLTRAIAINDYLPHVFTLRGRRLLYSWGIYVLVALTGALLIFFGGVTDRLIPLYAVGAFLAFTLSQAGMVMHWYRKGKSRVSMAINAVGALATGTTLLVVLVAKFMAGAWITAMLVPLLIALMLHIRRHYRRVQDETAEDKPLNPSQVKQPIVIMPIDRWSRISEGALRFALSLSTEILVVHVQAQEDPDTISQEFEQMIAAPIRAAGRPVPRLVILKSPYRYVLNPLLDYVLATEKEHPDRQICVLVAELVARHWYENFFHNKRADLLKVKLLLQGNQHIVVINVPWYLKPSA